MRPARRSVGCCGQETPARTPPPITLTLLDRALEQVPGEPVEQIEILVRADSAGATHGLTDYCREARIRFSIGYEMTETVRAAILKIPADAWVSALTRRAVPRERPHP